MVEERIAEIKKVIEGYLASSFMQLVELQFKKGKRNILRILVDRKQGGITVDECAKINEEISLILDKQGLLVESYILEVSSPGIDRPLVTKEDFERKMGKKVRITLKETEFEKEKDLSGKIAEVDEKKVVIKTDEGKVKKIAFDDIKKAKIKLEW